MTAVSLSSGTPTPGPAGHPDSRLFLLILLTDETHASPSAERKQEEASGGPGRRQVCGMAGQRGILPLGTRRAPESSTGRQ